MKIVSGEADKNSQKVHFVMSKDKPTGLTVTYPTEIETAKQLALIIRSMIRTSRDRQVEYLAISYKNIPADKVGLSEYELGRLFSENAHMAVYEFSKYKSGVTYNGVKTICVENAPAAFLSGAKDGEVVAAAINNARDLSNTPGKDLTPKDLVTNVKKLTSKTKVSLQVLNKKQISDLKMGLVLGVSQGSVADPAFLILSYFGAKKNEAPIVLVGKGVTYDTGGLSLKPTDGMLGMHHDMAGAATVIAAICAAERLKLKKNVIALVPAVENAISGSAYRPGDILTSMNGTTVEVLNTDAEGRLILADALLYAQKFNPRVTIDVATLTGASLVALGKRASALFTQNEELATRLMQLSDLSGDALWRLPLWDEFKADIKGTFADVSNVAPGGSRFGGASIGAAFLAYFTKSLKVWAHIDIAPRMESIPEDNLAKGATGEPVRLLVRALEQL